jgi:hypothetical protein
MKRFVITLETMGRSKYYKVVGTNEDGSTLDGFFKGVFHHIKHYNHQTYTLDTIEKDIKYRANGDAYTIMLKQPITKNIITFVHPAELKPNNIIYDGVDRSCKESCA